MLLVRSDPGLEAQASAVADRIVERSAAAHVDVVRAPPFTHADTADVADAATRAEEAFAALRLDEARTILDEALAAADRGALRSSATIVGLLLLAAMVDDALGRSESADRDALGALAIAPELTIDAARYPPTLAARIDRVRPSLARCAVTIVTDPVDATLRIDGDEAPAPSVLGCGAHWISASRSGYEPAHRRITLVSSEAADVALVLLLDPAAALATVGEPSAPITPLAERGAAALGRELSVLTIARDDRGEPVARLGARTVRLGALSPDQIAATLLAPVEDGNDEVILGVSLGAGSVALLAVAIALGVVLAPAPAPGWTGVGEVVRP